MKATKATINQRVTEVLKLRVAGAEFSDIRDYAIAHGWDVSDSQLWRYVAKSDEALAAAVEKNRDKLVARHLAQRRLLYAKALETGDWRGALAALKDEAELLDLYPHTGGEGPPPGSTAQAEVYDVDEQWLSECTVEELRRLRDIREAVNR